MELYKQYIEALKNGKQIRIKYNERNEDFYEGWWSEELWVYDREGDNFRCYYPVSSYEKNFYSIFEEEVFELVFKEVIRDLMLEDDIIVEDFEHKFYNDLQIPTEDTTDFINFCEGKEKEQNAKREIKELSWRGMTTTQVIKKLKEIADSTDYCEIEGYLCRAICLLEQYRDEYDFVHRDDD